MKQINYKSDFDFILALTDREGNAIGFPAFDWQAKFYTQSIVRSYIASCKGGVMNNCSRNGDELHIVADSHGLLAGRLNVELTIELPNESYPDGMQKIIVTEPLDVELINGNNYQAPFKVEIALPLPLAELPVSPIPPVIDNNAVDCSSVVLRRENLIKATKIINGYSYNIAFIIFDSDRDCEISVDYESGSFNIGQYSYLLNICSEIIATSNPDETSTLEYVNKLRKIFPSWSPFIDTALLGTVDDSVMENGYKTLYPSLMTMKTLRNGSDTCINLYITEKVYKEIIELMKALGVGLDNQIWIDDAQLEELKNGLPEIVAVAPYVNIDCYRDELKESIEEIVSTSSVSTLSLEDEPKQNPFQAAREKLLSRFKNLNQTNVQTSTAE